MKRLAPSHITTPAPPGWLLEIELKLESKLVPDEQAVEFGGRLVKKPV
jgi:hypothetical protein